MPAIFEYRLVVPPSAIDALGHANNTVYFQWMEATATAHSTEQGWSTEQYLERGIAWVARSHSIEYRRPAFAGDRIVVRTWVCDMHKVSSSRRYRILRELDQPEDGAEFELLARAETRWVLIDLQSRRPIRVPEDVASCFDLVDQPPSDF